MFLGNCTYFVYKLLLLTYLLLEVQKNTKFLQYLPNIAYQLQFWSKTHHKKFWGPNPSGSLLTGHALFLRAPYTGKITKIGHFRFKMSRYDFETNLLKYKCAKGIEFI